MTVEIIAISVSAVSIMLAVIGATYKVINGINVIRRDMDERINNLENKFAKYSVKIDTLWEIYGEEAIREARTLGITEHRSPDHISEKAIAMLTDSMYNTLIDSGNQLLEKNPNPKEVAFQLFVSNKETFARIAEEHNISLKVFVGLSNVIVDKCLNDKLGNSGEK